MRPWACVVTLAAASAAAASASGERLLETGSLNACQRGSRLTASRFTVVYTASNRSASVNVVATSSIQGKVMLDVALSVYGHRVYRGAVNPCKRKLTGLCPLSPGKIDIPFSLTLDAATAARIPAAAFQVPDLDATARVLINASATGESLACLEADISNGRTVHLPGVEAATATPAPPPTSPPAACRCWPSSRPRPCSASPPPACRPSPRPGP